MNTTLPAFPLPKGTLARFGLRAKKSFGQNFLTDVNLVDQIATLAGPAPAQVVEIGAGLGGLTERLLARGHRVTAIERDRDLLPVLSELFAAPIATGQLRLLEADAKAIDLPTLFDGEGPRILMGNLPYQLTGPLLQNTVNARTALDAAVFLLQREVTDRLMSAPSSKDYGALGVFCQAAFRVERPMLVRRGAFYPQPNVDSAVVRLLPEDPPRAVETPAFRELVKRAFAGRRKTLRNAWRGALGLGEEALRAAAGRAGIDLERRGETLSVEEFAEMARQARPEPTEDEARPTDVELPTGSCEEAEP